MIIESQYRVPEKNGVQAFADFYTLNYLWFYFGSGKEAHGYKSVSVIFPKKLSDRIDRSFEESAFGLGNLLKIKLLEAVYDELQNMVDEYIIPNQEDLKKYLMKNNIMLPVDSSGNMILPPFKDFWSKYGLVGAYRMFMYPGWTNEKSDIFGGKKWADIVNATRDLISAWKNDRGQSSLKNIIYAIDKIYDLEHHTGAVGEKLGDLFVSKSHLNKRFSAKSVQDLVNLGVSPYVKNLSNAVQSLARQSPLNERIMKPDSWGKIILGRYA